MSPTNFNTENRTYRQLLGNGLTYRIPRFQRDYSWGEEEWEDLWADILGTLPDDGEQAHYMGYLVLQTANQRQFSVIDGQQRLTTVSLIVLAAMRILQRLSQDAASDGANAQRLQQLRATYIGYLDPVTLTTQNKLSLNRNNDSYYRDYLVPLAEHLPQRGFPASTHAMRKAFEWFEARLKQRMRGEADPGMALAQLVETLSDKLFFTVITVADELNAYKVFETLNARGVRLSATDLLKNYLFSVLARDPHSQATTDELERRWESIIGRLGSESFPDFLRMHWNSRNTFARQTDLFKAVRQRITSSGEVFALLRGIDEDIDTYLALTQPDGAQWPAACLRSAQELRMFSVRQPYPMLLAAHRALKPAEFEGLLRATVVIAFRYNVIGAQRTGDQERLYHQIALQLHRGEVDGLQAVLQALKPIYRSDEAFKADFREKAVKTSQSRNAKVVRYILSALEKEAGGADLDPVAAGLSIEHIFPQAADAGWDAFSERDQDTFVHRLGNLALLESALNRDLANAPYASKRPALAASAITTTRHLAATYDDWTPETLAARQAQMARRATAIWRIAQLS
jgi:hypothetical protein